MTSRQKNTLTVAMTTAFITSFMGSSLNLAIPNIEAQFGVGASIVGWVVTAYMLTTSALNVPFGKIADVTGRRWVIICGIGTFSVASLIGAFSVNIAMLFAMRVLQGVGAAMIFSTNNAILMSAFPASERGSVLGKSTASTVSSLYTGGQPLNAAAITSNNGQSDVVARLQQMLEESYIEGFVKDGKGFNEWAATAARFGIRDLNAAMDEAGYARKDIEAYFEQKQTEQGKDEARQEKIDQQDHRDKSRMFYIDQLARMDTSIETLNVTNALLTSILEGQTDFYQGRFASWNVTWNSFLDRWTRYFIENQYYNSRTGLDYAAIKAQEHQESKGAIYALAEAFNNGVSDLSDPTVQTNALLSKILLVVSSIMQQNAAKGGSALTDTLSALAMGLTTPAP